MSTKNTTIFLLFNQRRLTLYYFHFLFAYCVLCVSRMLAAAPPSVPEEPSAVSPPGMLKRQTSAIPEGDNEDGDEEDMAQFLDDEEPVVSDYLRYLFFFL